MNDNSRLGSAQLRGIVRDLFVDQKSKDVYDAKVKFWNLENVKKLGVGEEGPVGVEATHLPEFSQLCEGDQYFPHIDFGPEVGCWECLSKNEVFLDCGAYDGDTLRDFINRVGGEYRKTVSFEPDPVVCKKIEAYVQEAKLQNAYVVNGGILDYTGSTHFFYEAASGYNTVTPDGNAELKVWDLDSFELAQDATFIKMDIEGSELKALQGAKNIIMRNRPRLAICMYHKPEDLTDIPLYLQTICKDYMFALRHHNNTQWETVLYAMPKPQHAEIGVRGALKIFIHKHSPFRM